MNANISGYNGKLGSTVEATYRIVRDDELGSPYWKWVVLSAASKS